MSLFDGIFKGRQKEHPETKEKEYKHAPKTRKAKRETYSYLLDRRIAVKRLKQLKGE